MVTILECLRMVANLERMHMSAILKCPRMVAILESTRMVAILECLRMVAILMHQRMVAILVGISVIGNIASDEIFKVIFINYLDVIRNVVYGIIRIHYVDDTKDY